MLLARSIGDRFLDILSKNQQRNTIEDACSIGKVVSTNPLVIDVQGLQLTESELNINKHLLEWDETVNITTSLNDNHTHTITTIHHPSKLNVGDYVSLYGQEPDEISSKGTYQKWILQFVLK